MTSQTFKIAIYQYSNSNLSPFLRFNSARFFQAQKDTQQAERVIWEKHSCQIQIGIASKKSLIVTFSNKKKLLMRL